jgi:lipopolysaccharide/colanic/teichoic acid biosynthesis glycosyltransferase
MSRPLPASPLDLDHAVRPAAPQRSVWSARRTTLLMWQGAGLVLGAVLIAIAKLQLPASAAGTIFVETLALGWLAALGSVVLLDALVGRQPYLHVTAALASVLAAFGALFIGYIATHAVYSRWAVFIAFAFALAMHLQAWRRWRRLTTLRLGVLDEAILERLAPASRLPSDAAAFDRCDWLLLREDTARNSVDGVVLPDDMNPALRQRAALRAKLAGAQVYSESFVRALLTGRLDVDRADAVFLDDVPTSFVYAAVKRALDLTGALLLGVFALPLTLVAIVLIRLESPGAALMAQPRVGLRGQVFSMCKLRTMREHAGGAAAAPAFEQDSAARITRVGRWLRRTRFDELPQLWNVIRGEMSLIGPRPEWVETAAALERQIPQFGFRYLVRPGITGWAQVHQGHVTAERASRAKLEYDLYYAKNMSLALDLAIGALTIRTVLTGIGAK